VLHQHRSDPGKLVPPTDEVGVPLLWKPSGH